MTRGYAVLIAAIVSLAGTPAAVHGQNPAELRVGWTSLALVAEGTRTDQLGGNTLYTVAVYAEERPLDLAHLASADAPKALRIEVVNDDDPFSPLTRPWRRELVPRLDPAATTQLKTATAASATAAGPCRTGTTTSARRSARLMQELDAFLLGRRTYVTHAEAFEPMPARRSVRLVMNAPAKYVVSKTLEKPIWRNTTIIRDDVVGAVRALKAKPGQGHPDRRQQPARADADRERSRRRASPARLSATLGGEAGPPGGRPHVVTLKSAVPYPRHFRRATGISRGTIRRDRRRAAALLLRRATTMRHGPRHRLLRPGAPDAIAEAVHRTDAAGGWAGMAAQLSFLYKTPPWP